jgi:hypothetical protein
VGCLLILVLPESFDVLRLFNLMQTHLSILALFLGEFESYSEDYLCLYIPVFPVFFPCSSLNVSSLTLRSLIHLDLIFIQGER